MARIATKVREVPGMRCEIGNSGIDHAATALHEFTQTTLATKRARRSEHQSQSFLDEIFKLLPAQRRHCLRFSVKVIW
jgi:hypothetical protein